MKLTNILKSVFSKSQNTPYKECERTIKKLGYKKQDQGVFVRDSSSGRTTIWLYEDSVKIKVYASGYAESDYLPAPLPDAETLRSFIRRNEL
ncbi:hypothetical protein OX284_011715 [Flavobacterium sp. SUN046]|uniref:hypothetical protein n=1 Tax=Flavobacterium sp. SUN046 TaxID=3002440 RepID=UPI002DB55B26|nr:hypothetical protein [Flavobacterium sp. SUN046]MEC4050100.1 hypothetical protein [Flavobacterium sp. SUN046]